MESCFESRNTCAKAPQCDWIQSRKTCVKAVQWNLPLIHEKPVLNLCNAILL